MRGGILLKKPAIHDISSGSWIGVQKPAIGGGGEKHAELPWDTGKLKMLAKY